MSKTILILPFHGQGHVFPCSELCIRLASRNYNITLVLPSPSFAASSLHHHPLINISFLHDHDDEVGGGGGGGPPPPPFPPNPKLTTEPLVRLLSLHPHPTCVIIDVMMSWAADTFREINIPIFTFFTSGACSAAMEFALSKLQPPNPNPSGHPQVLKLPGLPDDVSLTLSDLSHQQGPPPPRSNFQPTRPPPPHSSFPPHRPPPAHTSFRPPGPPPHVPFPGPGRPPPWLAETEGSIALLMNTCDELERPFLEYLGKETGKPVWGVGPLLPAKYWEGADVAVHDREIRSGPTRETNVGEEEVIQWLDKHPRGSVVYVAFGTEVGPSKDELDELAAALEKSDRPFIWAVQPGEADGQSFPDERVLLIRGWAPQLMILSHPSTGGFVSHCGWNSMTEALGRGVPLLAWPIRGDQHYNAKLVTGHLKAGLMVRSGGDGATAVTRDDIVRGIERLMGDDEMRSRARAIRGIFDDGFPSSSWASLDAFLDLLNTICQ